MVFVLSQTVMHKYMYLGTVQVSWQGSAMRAADGESAVPLPRQNTAQEQRDSQHRFKRAYVDVQLAKQWAAGQTWAELDACGVPWSPESSVTAEDRWQEVWARTTFNHAGHDEEVAEKLSVPKSTTAAVGSARLSELQGSMFGTGRDLTGVS